MVGQDSWWEKYKHFCETGEVLPIFGQETRITRVCNWVDGPLGDSQVNCGKLGAIHVCWRPPPDGRLSFLCEEHKGALSQFGYYREHPMGAACGMPGSIFFFDENACGYENGLPVADKIGDKVMLPVGSR